LLGRGALAVAAWHLTSTTAMAASRSPRDAADHVLLGAPDLTEAIAWLESKTGVRAAIGGSHPGVGTRNALVALGRRQYLEIIAPDPAQSTFNFHIDLRKLAGPRLVTWAASAADVDDVAAAARRLGLQVFGPQDGSRLRPDGVMLKWRSAGVRADFAGSDVDPVPFFIQWAADAKHPSEDSPAGCRLTALEIGHPEPARLRALLAKLDIDAPVARADAAHLTATLETPKGRVRLE
jgi:Glyoxalase-like domain